MKVRSVADRRRPKDKDDACRHRICSACARRANAALAQETFTVAPKTVADEKAVFATVESANVVPARARIGGTVVELAVKEGDEVKQGQVVATVGDEKLALADEVARCADRRS